MTYHYDGHGPGFGGGRDLVIDNKANKNRNSYANIGYTYKHKNYTYGNK